MSLPLRFRSLIFRTGAELHHVGHVLLLKTNRKPHLRSSTAPLDLTLSDRVSRVKVKVTQIDLEGLYVVHDPRWIICYY